MLALLTISREQALHAQFLRGDALRRTDNCDQRKVREALVPAPEHDGQNRALRNKRRLQRRNAGILAQPLQQVLEFLHPAPAPQLLSEPFLFGEASLRRALTEFIDHYHGERNHQGKGNLLLFPHHEVGQQKPRRRVRCRERLGGLLRYYSYVA
jgi:hypothetical protein